MMSLKLFVSVATIVVSTWAAIPWSDVQTHIFDSRPRDFELRVLKLMNTTRKFYAQHNVTSMFDVLASHAPYVGEMITAVRQLRDTMVEQSQWRIQFTKAISDETLRGIADSEIHRMKSTMQTVETKIKILGDDNPDLSNRKTIVSILHTELDKLINFFDLKSSLFRKYPLMGAPPLIQLASLIAIFSPFAKALNPLEAMNPQISCKIRDVLLDFRPRAVNARFHQIHADLSIFESKVKVMSMPYNAHGYNRTDSNVIDCDHGCKTSTQSNKHCLKDNFGSDEFSVNIDGSTCVEDYALMIRQRVEELFPIDMLNKICIDSEQKTPTGKLEVLPRKEFSLPSAKIDSFFIQ